MSLPVFALGSASSAGFFTVALDWSSNRRRIGKMFCASRGAWFGHGSGLSRYGLCRWRPTGNSIIVLELTLSYEFTLIAPRSVIVSQVISSHLFGNSFFDWQLLDRGVDLRFGRGKFRLS